MFTASRPYVTVLAWDFTNPGEELKPADVGWAAKGVGIVVLIGGWIAVGVLTTLAQRMRTRRRLQERSRKAKMFKAAVQRTVGQCNTLLGATRLVSYTATII